MNKSSSGDPFKSLPKAHYPNQSQSEGKARSQQERTVIMGFNVPHWGTISSGQSFPVGYTFGGKNQGAQFAEGMPENPGGFLISDQAEIFMDNNGGIIYQFTLTNIGSNTSFGLDGGGFS